MYKIAKEDGVALSNDKGNADVEDQEENDDEEIAEFVRFFHHHDDDELALFVECGLNRKIKVSVDPKHTNLQLSISIPPPPDQLISHAALEHSFANEIVLKETSRIFNIPSPGMLKPKKHKIIYFPNQEEATWVIFKFNFESLLEEQPLEVNVNMKPSKKSA